MVELVFRNQTTAKCEIELNSIKQVAFGDREDLPAPTRQLKAIYNSSSKRSSFPFWPPWTLHAHGTQTQADTTLIHIELKSNACLKVTSFHWDLIISTVN